ncbi:MAG: glycoside hydrolase family 38 C-terminal domain-containing protein [Edaphobacter sp.]|uniref:alpha-mannosidase n=1 Tax=Edaphobacter sp. TaxID=1934404 RepID=UPI00239B8AB7|nr:glycoside hydrolase family 38 C-terminal domain-containing protein [Edaphobacter sp.]MDE1175770.1 glycoside hydrolase family 38 C-terminal domain-containing protein [Edaphobacter sp.]
MIPLPRVLKTTFSAFCAPLLAATLCTTSAIAQINHALNAEGITKTLPPASQKTLDRLGSFSELPAAEWRYHAGDMAHGEDPALNDSSWEVVKPHSKAPNEAVWYRRLIEVPKALNGYDLTGARIWFQFRAGANGPMPEIVYFNGRRVALGEDLEPIVLFDNAKPGDKILVAVKLLQTVDTKSFNGVTANVDFAQGRPNPSDLRLEFLSSAVLVPSLSKNVAADMATVNQSIAMVDLSALDNGNQIKFDSSLDAARQKLDVLRPMLQQTTFHLTGNSHIDAAWLWPVTETVDAVKRTFSTALQLMNEYPDYTYTQSAAAYNDWMATKYPAINDQIKKRIKEGRWEIVGGMWVEPDLNMPDGESQVRSLLIGKRWYQKEYGVDVRIGWNPDSFGYNWQLPQIYKRSGVDYFVTQKMAWNDTNEIPFKLFWWKSPDGSQVLTYFPHDYANRNLNPVRLSSDMEVARKYAPGMDEMMDLYGVGDHGGGPTRAMLDEGVHWANSGMIVPNYKFGTAQSYFDNVEKRLSSNSPEWNYLSIARGYKAPAAEAGKIAIPTWDSELYLEYHRGVFTTQAQHKRNMRESEEQTINAEKYASLAWLSGYKYPNDQFTDAWKKIAFNGFHDLAAGSGIAVIYKEAQAEFDQVRLETGEISQDSLHLLASGINTKAAGETPVLVFNPLAWSQTGVTTVSVQLPAAASSISLLDDHDKVLPSKVLSSDAKNGSYKLLVQVPNVPSMGYTVLHAVAGQKTFPTDLKANGTSMENEFLRVEVDPKTGCITSLYDKKAKFESLAKGACGNQLQTFKDLPKDYDAWNIDPGTYDHMTPIEQVDSVQLVEKGPMRSVIRVSRTWQSSKFVQDIQLYAGSDTVDVINDIDWHETHVLLKAAFPLAASGPMATYEIPYGSIERPTTRNNSWEKAQFEVPALRWADLGDEHHGFSLLNEAKYGYDAEGNTLRLTLLRSPTWPDPDADRGHQHFSYALYPHAGTWKQAKTERRGYEYNYELKAQQVTPHAGALPLVHSYASVEPENVVLTAMKKAEDDNGLIFRVVEWAGKQGDVTFTVPPGATAATETNLMEKSTGSPLKLSGDKVTAHIGPYEILSVRVDYPASSK